MKQPIIPRFRKGQEVQVATFSADKKWCVWNNAKIVNYLPEHIMPEQYSVQFPDGSSGLFNTEHVRHFMSPK